VTCHPYTEFNADLRGIIASGFTDKVVSRIEKGTIVRPWLAAAATRVLTR
jgi:antirestriction protein ArdC